LEEEVEGEYTCHECGLGVSGDYAYCPNCGAALDDEEVLPVRYLALRTIAGVYQILAFTVAIVATIGIVFALLNLGAGTSALILLGLSVLGGTVGVITFFAASESIKVFVDIEENTRRTAELLIKKL
jgi:hypothetical protein